MENSYNIVLDAFTNIFNWYSSKGCIQLEIFYTGIELGNAQNGTVDLGRFSLDNMESVTLYNGQK